MHYWGVWWGKEPFSIYKEKTGRFVSEYGFQGFPALETIAAFTLPGDRQLNSPVMKAHQKHPVGYETIDEYLLRDYKKPKDFDSYVYVSQLLQAEGIKTAIEAHRRAKPYCMGTLYWQLNDCWPVVSWSSRDYFGREKALHYFLKNEYGTLLVSPLLQDNTMKVFVVSDSLRDCPAQLHLRLQDFSGNIHFDTTLAILVEANSSRSCYEFPFRRLIRIFNPGQLVFSADLMIGEKYVSRNNYYFQPVKDLLLEKPVIRKTVKKSQEGYLIALSSDKLAKNVWLTSAVKGTFSDNFFDLLPGETLTIRFNTKDKTSAFADKLKIQTIADTY
jgi:beta-mannosidase